MNRWPPEPQARAYLTGVRLAGDVARKSLPDFSGGTTGFDGRTYPGSSSHLEELHARETPGLFPETLGGRGIRTSATPIQSLSLHSGPQRPPAGRMAAGFELYGGPERSAPRVVDWQVGVSLLAAIESEAPSRPLCRHGVMFPSRHAPASPHARRPDVTISFKRSLAPA